MPARQKAAGKNGKQISPPPPFSRPHSTGASSSFPIYQPVFPPRVPSSAPSIRIEARLHPFPASFWGRERCLRPSLQIQLPPSFKLLLLHSLPNFVPLRLFTFLPPANPFVIFLLSLRKAPFDRGCLKSSKVKDSPSPTLEALKRKKCYVYQVSFLALAFARRW